MKELVITIENNKQVETEKSFTVTTKQLNVEKEAAKNSLRSFNQSVREQIITRGPTVSGINISCDTRTLLIITELRNNALIDNSYTYSGFYANNGVFTLTADKIKSLHTACYTLIKNAFETYTNINTKIDNETITNMEQITSGYSQL